MATLVFPKTIVEYPLPGAVQTHELVSVNGSLIVVSQQSDSKLVKMARDPQTGLINAAASFTIGSEKDGLHGLRASEVFPGMVWATLQFTSKLLLINPNSGSVNAAPEIVRTIDVPFPGRGPHVVIEEGEYLWVTLKDSAHVLHINFNNPSEYTLYKAARKPIFVARHPTNNRVYVSQDQSSKILEIDTALGFQREIDVPEEEGATPVGLIAGPDGNVWFTLAGPQGGAQGTFVKIDADGEFNYFHLTTDQGSTAGLLHLAFEVNQTNLPRLHLVASTIADSASFDGVITVTLDADYSAIDTQTTYTFPTQLSKLHRVLVLGDQLFVTELSTSAVAQIFLPVPAATPIDEDDDYYSLFGQGAADTQVEYANPTIR
ncbi:MAG: hypothetical protein AAGD38_14435 [Acidobacteriota bacterium]